MDRSHTRPVRHDVDTTVPQLSHPSSAAFRDDFRRRELFLPRCGLAESCGLSMPAAGVAGTLGGSRGVVPRLEVSVFTADTGDMGRAVDVPQAARGDNGPSCVPNTNPVAIGSPCSMERTLMGSTAGRSHTAHSTSGRGMPGGGGGADAELKHTNTCPRCPFTLVIDSTTRPAWESAPAQSVSTSPSPPTSTRPRTHPLTQAAATDAL